MHGWRARGGGGGRAERSPRVLARLPARPRASGRRAPGAPRGGGSGGGGRRPPGPRQPPGRGRALPARATLTAAAPSTPPGQCAIDGWCAGGARPCEGEPTVLEGDSELKVQKRRWVTRASRGTVFFFAPDLPFGRVGHGSNHTHASCSSNTTYSTSGHGKGSFQFQVCPSTESQETFGN